MVARRHLEILGQPNDPPLVSPRPAYELAGRFAGKAVFVLCPGPSLTLFPRDVLARATTLAVNSAVEVYIPTFWVFNEPKLIRFFWKPLIAENRVGVIVTERPNAWISPWLPAGASIYWYEYQLPIRRRIKGAKPWWLWPERSFLPGHATVTANAVSLAELLGARIVVLVGCDQTVYPGGKYYCDGVGLNPGPWDPQGAIKAGREWFESALLGKKLWGVPIVQVAPSCVLRVPQISPEDAVALVEEDSRG